jgi:hypothetical protein
MAAMTTRISAGRAPEDSLCPFPEYQKEVGEAEDNAGMQRRDKHGEQQGQRIDSQLHMQRVVRSGNFLLHTDGAAWIGRFSTTRRTLAIGIEVFGFPVRQRQGLGDADSTRGRGAGFFAACASDVGQRVGLHAGLGMRKARVVPTHFEEQARSERLRGAVNAILDRGFWRREAHRFAFDSKLEPFVFGKELRVGLFEASRPLSSRPVWST